MTTSAPQEREVRLVASLARLDLETTHLEEARALLREPLDWNRVLVLCERHGLAPLFERHLPTLSPDGVPKAIRATFWARARATALRNRALAVELAQVTALLDRHGIASIPYKGPTLALCAYGDLTLREFGDLDLLVRARDALRAKDVLAQRGYAMLLPLTPVQEKWFVASPRHYDLSVADRARGHLVELHWRADPDIAILPLEDDAWWDSLQRVALEGQPMRSLSAEELLLVLSLHGTKHFWSSLGWLVDIAELLRRTPRLDASWLRAQARLRGCERKLALSLLLARDVLGAAVPGPLLPDASERCVHEIAALLRERLFATTQEPFGIARALWLNLRLRDRWTQRIAHAWKAIVTPGWGEWSVLRLPRPLFFLYLPFRFVRLAAKYGLPARSGRIASREPELPPRFEDGDGHGIGQVEAAIPRAHR